MLCSWLVGVCCGVSWLGNLLGVVVGLVLDWVFV